MIIAILAALFLGALQQAQQAADVAATRALIAKLHGQLLLRWESYRTRRLPPASATASSSPLETGLQRLVAMRELMRMELPERYSDFLDRPIRDVPVNAQYGLVSLQPAVPNPPAWVPAKWRHGGVSSASRSYLRRYYTNAVNGAFSQPTTEFEDAECLYLIITTGLADDSLANEQISPIHVGDADGDGMPEFKDAWGNPIRFLRWAPGFTSELQPRDGKKNHDPFDPRGIQQDAYTLYPLIYSAGLDREGDIYHGPANYSCRDHTFNSPAYGIDVTYNPYFFDSNIMKALIGTADVDNDGDNSADNIHNHLIGLP